MKLNHLSYAEVAKALNISPASVSFAVSGKPGVSAKTRQKILDYIAEHDHDDFDSENNLSSKSNSNILIVFPEGSSEIYSSAHTKILKAAQEEAQNNSFILQATYQMPGQNTFQYVEDLKKYPNVAGALILATELDEKIFSMYRALKMPLICVNSYFETLKLASVETDYQTAIFKAVEYAVNLEHKEIAFIYEPSFSQNLQHKLDGFWKALRVFGLQNSNPNSIIDLPNNINKAYRKMLKLLDNPEFHYPTLFIGESDYSILGAMRAFEEKNISIPDKVSFIGCGNIDASQVSKPSLTTIEPDYTELGKISVRNLVRLIKSPNDSPTRTQIFTKFIKRNSVKNLKNLSER